MPCCHHLGWGSAPHTPHFHRRVLKPCGVPITPRQHITGTGACKAASKRRAVTVRAEAAKEENAGGKGDMQLAPVKPRTQWGEMVSYYLKMEPHLFSAAVEQQFHRLKKEREAAAEKAGQLSPESSNSELVLYRRMEEVKSSEQRATVEDLMYASVLEKFVELGLDMLPRVENVAEQPQTLKTLTEGIHSKEALDLVKEHVRSVMGPASMAYSNSMIKMSRLQAAQVYVASILFGYFVRRVDKRFQLEVTSGLLAETQEDAVARLERLFAEADAMDATDNPDSAPSVSDPDTISNSSSRSSSNSTAESTASSPASPKKGALRRYVEQFDQAMMLEMTRIVSAEGAALVEAQTNALLGDIKQLQRQMQEAVGTDASSMEELMERVQKSVMEGTVDSLTITVGTQRRVVLEAIAFGTFLRDVEAHVDSEYGLLTPARLPPPDMGGGGGGGGGSKVPNPVG